MHIKWTTFNLICSVIDNIEELWKTNHILSLHDSSYCGPFFSSLAWTFSPLVCFLIRFSSWISSLKQLGTLFFLSFQFHPRYQGSLFHGNDELCSVKVSNKLRWFIEALCFILNSHSNYISYVFYFLESCFSGCLSFFHGCI